CQFNATEYKFEMNFVMDTFEEDGQHIDRYKLTFNNETKYFNEYQNTLLQLTNIQYIIICNENDIDKPENEKETLLFWNTSTYTVFISTSIFVNAFPIWYDELRKEKKKSYCLRIDSVGWYKNAYEEICTDKKPCPDLIMIGTSQLSVRYYRNETISLNQYIRNYYHKTGKSLDALLNKYSHFDYRVDNNWIAVPIAVDFRVFRFNITSFDYCKEKGYDLHYPP
ncbi:hypothetical protein BCR36DRAFT_225862, partial [Piromyces finnis]